MLGLPARLHALRLLEGSVMKRLFVGLSVAVTVVLAVLFAPAVASADGLPWIWRLGVDGSLRGLAGQSSAAALATTGWTEMVTADGATCVRGILRDGV